MKVGKLLNMITDSDYANFIICATKDYNSEEIRTPKCDFVKVIDFFGNEKVTSFQYSHYEEAYIITLDYNEAAYKEAKKLKRKF